LLATPRLSDHQSNVVHPFPHQTLIRS
jgi:hypothetical protein